jgi:glycosyltransferase involved in cell wall biosynthesis
VLDVTERLHQELPTAVCCLDEPGAWSERLRAKGIEVTALDRAPGFRPALGRRIADLARRHRADVVHAHHYSPFVYSALARLRHPSLRIVFTEHGRLSDAPPSPKRRLANRVLRAMPHRVFAVSEDVRQHLIGEGFGERAVGVIYNGIDVGPRPSAETRARARERIGATDRTFVVGTIARLDPVKDLSTLVRAAAGVSRQLDIAVVVIGDGPERDKLERLSIDAGLGPSIRFLGHRDDARDWLAGFDAYVNSSISEGVSLTILEAMAAALPVVATRVGGTPEVVDDSCGRLVPARDLAPLAGALGELAASPDLGRRLGDAARARVESRFTIEQMVEAYRQVYLEIGR